MPDIPVFGYDRQGQPIEMSRERAKLQEVAGKLFLDALAINDQMNEYAEQARKWRERWEEAQDDRDATLAVLHELRVTQEEAIGWCKGQMNPRTDLTVIVTNEERRKELEALAKMAEVEQEGEPE